MALRPASRAMISSCRSAARTNFSNASSCSLTMSLVAWSVSSSEPSANFLAEKFTNTSGRMKHHRLDRGEALAQVILHARAAEQAAGAGLDRHRLAFERVVLHARGPVDGVLEAARNGPVVFRGHDDDAIGLADGIGPRRHRRGKAAALVIEIVDRDGGPRRRRRNLHACRRKRRQRALQRGVERRLAQRAADGNDIQVSHS